MDPEKRLDQLEPFTADMIRKQDLLSNQNKALAGMIFDLAVGQSQIKSRLDVLEADGAQLKTDMAQLKTDVAEIPGKLDMILTLLRGQNGH